VSTWYEGGGGGKKAAASDRDGLEDGAAAPLQLLVPRVGADRAQNLRPKKDRAPFSYGGGWREIFFAGGGGRKASAPGGGGAARAGGAGGGAGTISLMPGPSCSSQSYARLRILRAPPRVSASCACSSRALRAPAQAERDGAAGGGGADA